MSQPQTLSLKLMSFANQIQADLTNKSEKWTPHHDEISDCFGGLDTMVYLCLSNTNCKDFMNQETLKTLEGLVYHYGLIDGNDAQKDVQVRPIEIVMDQHDTRRNNNYNSSKYICFSNFTKFYSHSMIIKADPLQNIYHTKLHLSLQQTQFIVFTVLFSKWFFLSSFGIAGILYASSQIYWLIIGLYTYTPIYIAIFVASQLTALLLAISYLLSANVDIIVSTIQTFDFWYKIYNLITSVVCLYFVGGRPPIVYVSSQMTFITGYIMVCLADALCISNRKKIIINGLCIFALMYIIPAAYFNIPDANWNPFDSPHTRINFKSVMISGWVNVMLFSFKPIFSQISRRCRHGATCKSQTTTNIHNDTAHTCDGKLRQRSYFLYKRPVISWQFDKHDQEIARASADLG